MRFALLFLAACTASTDTPSSPDATVTPDAAPPKVCPTATATIMRPFDSAPPRPQVEIQWSASVPHRYIDITDAAGNQYSTGDLIAAEGDFSVTDYNLPAGRTFTLEAGFVCDSGERKKLATTTFTTVPITSCDQQTTSFSTTITSPTSGQVIVGTLKDSQFLSTSPRVAPDQYRNVYDETAGHVMLFYDLDRQGYPLAAGHEYLAEIGWECSTENRFIPLASKRFLAAP